MAVFKIIVRKEKRVTIEASSLDALKQVLDWEDSREKCLDADLGSEGDRTEYSVIAEEPEGTSAQMVEREGHLYPMGAAAETEMPEGLLCSFCREGIKSCTCPVAKIRELAKLAKEVASTGGGTK